MTFLKRMFSRKPEPGQRVRICVECGMPIAEHKKRVKASAPFTIDEMSSVRDTKDPPRFT